MSEGRPCSWAHPTVPTRTFRGRRWQVVSLRCTGRPRQGRLRCRLCEGAADEASVWIRLELRYALQSFGKNLVQVGRAIRAVCICKTTYSDVDVHDSFQFKTARFSKEKPLATHSEDTNPQIFNINLQDWFKISNSSKLDAHMPLHD